MSIVKIKDLKTGDLAKSINLPDAPELLIIAVSPSGFKHAVFGDSKIFIDDDNHAWENEVLLVSENNDVSRYRKVYRLNFII